MALLDVPSKRAVVEAGKVLARTIDESEKELAIEVFGIAYAWRDAHIVPLRRIRAELVGKIRKNEFNAPTAARLKRMKSIRGKLARMPLTLHQMQDVGGCRVILPSMEQVNKLVTIYKDGRCKHELARPYDYVSEPKDDGYRCHHLIMKFVGSEKEETFAGRKIEMQVRSHLQHSWATAVEAVGLYRGEDLKAGIGNADWLRFFQLISAEFAEQERSPIVPNTPATTRERRSEISDLNARLDILTTLRNFGQVVKLSDDVSTEADYFIIEFDRERRVSSIKPYHQFTSASEGYIEEEESIARDRLENVRNAVLVEVDRLDDLKLAYPNYFLDVDLFLEHLRGIVR